MQKEENNNNTSGGGGGGGGGFAGGFNGGGGGFKEEHLVGLAGLKREKGFIEMTCGCTSAKYGDAVARLRITDEGVFEIVDCECSPGGNCDEGTMKPPAFEKHAGNRSKKWKNNIWVVRHNKKLPLCKTELLGYYNSKGRGGGSKPKVAHRDEFVRCAACGKERRFKRRDREECRRHHSAANDPNWVCSDFPYERIGCEMEEERAASRKAYRGCGKKPGFACEGCSFCVCFGCNVCLFRDCNCRSCIDFYSFNH
ncbi:hypothetical protein SUGI_0093250 [Cryptomeria japonica]|uniref:protein ULTRAPETALA 1-like n=1 Tax=Cryptomeria japonica TaxID=3369 RepID=UPI0024089E47|nr:protein ULTRAPETALA 1-like [Cryptomeria japonica]GLJ08666.1 hypothetical protein SUGI_0093250 [Cryptomeria japonica]